MSFLLSTPHGYFFRIAVPADLRTLLGKREIKKSLRTFDPRYAKILAASFAAQCHTYFRDLRRESMSSNKLPLVHLQEFGIDKFRKNADGSIEISGLQMDPTKPEAEKELLQAFMAAIGGLTSSEPSISQTKPTPTTSPTLSEIIETYCTEKVECGVWRPKSEDENRASFALLLQIVGNLPVSTITYDMALGFLQTLKRLPPNVSKVPLYRGKSIAQVLAMKPQTVLSPQSVNKHCHRASTLFAWAVKRGFISQNHFEGLSVKKDTQAHEERDAFTDDDLTKLFSSKFFTTSRPKHPYFYWVPLIGLYSGLRLEEICQLHLEDFRKEGEVYVIDVNDRGEKKLKTLSSRRLVPIHSRLIDLGLLTYVERLRIDEETRLFPELTKMRDGYSQMVSKWFARYREQVGLGDSGRRLTFHSFRHTVADLLKQALVPEMIAAAILGHAEEGITYGRYGKDYKIQHLQDAIEKLSFLTLKNVRPY